MRNHIKSLCYAWKKDYRLSTIISSAVSALISAVFTLYNGILGIADRSIWHGSICIYYFFLAVIRVILLTTRKNNSRKVFILTHIMLFIMDALLIIPIAVMVTGKRSYTYGLIPAITMAAYTTYRIAMGIVHFLKSGNNVLLISELRTINLTDALVAVLSLQNALIIANNGMSEGMKTLISLTSAGIFIIIVVITIRSFLRIKRIT